MGPRLGWRRAAELMIGVVLAGLIVESLLRFVPQLFSARIEQECFNFRLGAGLYSPDSKQGVVLAVPFDMRERFQGRDIRVRHRPVPGEHRVGFRAGAEGDDPTQVDILVLGDSHAYGMEIDEASTWESVLGRRTGLRVANLGLPRMGTAQMRIQHDLYGGRFHPKLVLLMLCPNDFFDNFIFRSWVRRRGDGPASFRSHRLRAFLGGHEALMPLAFLTRYSYLLQLVLLRPTFKWVGILRKNLGAGPGPEGMAQLVGDVEALRAGSLANGARFAVVLTDLWTLQGEPGRQRERLAAELRRRRIPVLDLAETLCAPSVCPPGLYLPDGTHWNVHGQSRVAEDVQRFLRERGMLPLRRRSMHPE